MPVLIAWIALALLAPAQRLAPYAATPHDVVDRMLALAGVTATDVVVDLGCGDGRIPVRAAQKFGARGRGVDLDPRRIDEAQANARAAGVEHLTEFVVGDALKADVSEATVVTLFLGSEGNARLRPILQSQLRPGARIVSHAFSMGPEWPPHRVERFTSADGDAVTLYLWIIHAEGR
ncbi:MAG TPA: methyltransferase domain-containing protein [Vicinamibacterales bacterium]|nr:methyltransferase domain-containing protein [Vicinamibacterales bacterium]